MEEIIKLLFFIIFPIFISTFEGTYSYCCYLFWKYAKIDEYYNKYENGLHPISTQVLKKLCELYHVSADYILGLPKGLDWPG